MKKKKTKSIILLSLLTFIWLTIFIIPPVQGAILVPSEDFENWNVNNWANNTAGDGIIEITGEASRFGSYGMKTNGTFPNIGNPVDAFIRNRVRNTTGTLFYLGFWIRITNNTIISNNNEVQITALWDSLATWQYLEIRNDSGTLEWHPNEDNLGANASITRGVWYWVVEAYYIAVAGWERLWVDGDLIYHQNTDTSTWNLAQNVSIGLMEIQTTGTNTFCDFHFDNINIAETYPSGMPISNDGVTISNMEGCGNWVFAEHQTYNFVALYSHVDGYEYLEDMYINFSDGYTSMEFQYTQTTNSFGINVGENVSRLGVVEFTNTSSTQLQVTFPIYFSEEIFDAFEIDIYMRCTNGTFDTGWELIANNYFNIYNRGGHETLVTSGSAGRLTDGDVFDFYCYNSSSVEASMVYRNLVHVKMRPELTIRKENEVEDYKVHVEFGIDYCLNEDDWIEGWRGVLSIGEFFTVGERYTNTSVSWYHRGSYQGWKPPIFIFQEHVEGSGADLGGENIGSNETLIFYIDLWFNKLNSSSWIGGRFNSYYFPMDDVSNKWFTWISGSDWGIDEELPRSHMFFERLLDNSSNVAYAQEIKMVRLNCTLRIESSNYVQYAELKNFDIFAMTFSEDPLEGVQTPDEDKSQIPVMHSGMGGLIGWITGISHAIVSAIERTIGSAFVGFLKGIVISGIDAVFSAVGLGEKAFSQFLYGVSVYFAYIGEFASWAIGQVGGFIGLASSLVGLMVTGLLDGLANFVTISTNRLSYVVGESINVFSDFWGGTGDYAGGIAFSQIFTVCVIGFPVALMILITINGWGWFMSGIGQFGIFFNFIKGILQFGFNMLMKIIQFILDLIPF